MDKRGTIVQSSACIALLFSLFVAAESPASSPGADATNRQSNIQKIISIRMYVDMMYGADDYFGETTSLSYGDRTIPASKQKAQQAAAQPVVTTTRSSSRDDDEEETQEEQTTTTQSSSSPSTPSTPPPVINPGDVPPPPPPPPPPPI